MKKRIILLMVVAFMMGLTACGEQGESSGNSAVILKEESDEAESVPFPEETLVQDADTPDRKVLIVYFSYSGVTKGIAERLQQKTGGDIFELIPVDAYSKDMYEASDRAKEELESGKLPELTGELPDLSEYDAILVGGPVWSGTVAPAVVNYLQQSDLSGKLTAPFWTFNNNEGTYEADIRSYIPNGEIRDGLGLSNVSRYEEAKLNEEIDTWLDAVGLGADGDIVNTSETNITIAVGEMAIDAVLNDSAAAAEFAAMLPMTVTMTRRGEHEYYGGPCTGWVIRA